MWEDEERARQDGRRQRHGPRCGDVTVDGREIGMGEEVLVVGLQLPDHLLGDPGREQEEGLAARGPRRAEPQRGEPQRSQERPRHEGEDQDDRRRCDRDEHDRRHGPTEHRGDRGGDQPAGDHGGHLLHGRRRPRQPAPEQDGAGEPGSDQQRLDVPPGRRTETVLRPRLERAAEPVMTSSIQSRTPSTTEPTAVPAARPCGRRTPGPRRRRSPWR